MDLRSTDQCVREKSHNTIDVWWLVRPEELRGVTEGGYLEYVTEFEVAGGDLVEPHQHPSVEFYYVLHGRGRMRVGDDERIVVPGDLVHIPSDVVHSLEPVSEHDSVRCFTFAIADRGKASHYR
ncbi:cupin domain-containing protein [Micromonospora sp. KC213]|uniref:cupin domain-containing protein n=1 Tax=Micromonospora sp. KC213 TaxID=2530378 RepID=UPI001053D0E9|nr:cupin domain-containing protein [Micromonospora sp. KC213]TDC44271.1 cupin domain-containing protein [Micromonospora sp. KC213]